MRRLIFDQLKKGVSFTLNPELIDSGMYLRGLEADAEGRQDQDGHEQDLSRVALQETAEHKQLLLQPGADPERGAPAFDVTLQTNESYSLVSTKINEIEVCVCNIETIFTKCTWFVPTYRNTFFLQLLCLSVSSG